MGLAHTPHSLGLRNLLLAVAVVLATTTACSDSGENAGQNETPRPSADEVKSEPRVDESANGIRTLIAGTTDGGGDVAIEGLVALVNNCVGLTIGDTDYVVIWPAGSATNDTDDAIEITLPGATVVRPGTTVTGTGSFFAGDLPAATPPIPASCRSGNDVIVLDSAEIAS